MSTILVTVIIVASEHPGRAECIRIWKDIPDARRQAALVFSGTVIEEKPDPDGLFVTFEIDEVWKGPRERRLVLPLYMTIDSFRFAVGDKYLVFADHCCSPPGLRVPTTSEPVFEVSICSPTKVLGEARAALTQLGRGSKPK